MGSSKRDSWLDFHVFCRVLVGTVFDAGVGSSAASQYRRAIGAKLGVAH